jgi:hypothetical protein
MHPSLLPLQVWFNLRHPENGRPRGVFLFYRSEFWSSYHKSKNLSPFLITFLQKKEISPPRPSFSKPTNSRHDRLFPGGLRGEGKTGRGGKAQNRVAKMNPGPGGIPHRKGGVYFKIPKPNKAGPKRKFPPNIRPSLLRRFLEGYEHRR